MLRDEIVRSQCLGQLGLIAYERFKDARAAKRSIEEPAGLLDEAARLYERALQMLPETAITDRGIAHNQVGNIYYEAGEITRALQHYQKAIRYKEETGDTFGAGQTRYNIALALLSAGRLDDARVYEAALANSQTFGERAASEIHRRPRPQQLDAIRMLGGSVHELAKIQRGKGAASCADA